MRLHRITVMAGVTVSLYTFFWQRISDLEVATGPHILIMQDSDAASVQSQADAQLAMPPAAGKQSLRCGSTVQNTCHLLLSHRQGTCRSSRNTQMR